MEFFFLIILVDKVYKKLEINSVFVGKGKKERGILDSSGIHAHHFVSFSLSLLAQDVSIS